VNLEINALFFWACWVLTFLVIVEQFYRAWKFPRELLAFPTFVSMMWAYIYLYLPLNLVSKYADDFTSELWSFAQFSAFLSLFFLNLGWRRTYNRHATKPSIRPAWGYDLDRLRSSSFVLVAIGILGYWSFRNSSVGYQGGTAYWYLSFLVCYPGLAILIALMTISPRYRSPMSLITIAMMAAGVFIPLLLDLRRGPTFAAIIAIVGAYASFSLKPSRLLIVGSIGFAGVLLLVLVTLRYSKSSWFESDFINEALVKKSQSAADNEFYNHCQSLSANFESGNYQYGTVHLGMLVHWVPRFIWPDKPGRSVGFFPEAVRNLRLSKKNNLGFGGAFGPVADAFNNYWYFFPIYFLGVGWVTAVIFSRAQSPDALDWKMYNVALLTASHWFVAQCLTEAFVPLMIFLASFYAAFRYARFYQKFYYSAPQKPAFYPSSSSVR
jgi:hypothetical protein